MAKGIIKIFIGIICVAMGVIVILSDLPFLNFALIKGIAWNNVTNEYKTYLKIKDVKEVDELFNILKDGKVERTQTKDGTFKIYNDILINITNNKVNKISSDTMQAIYDMESENSRASVSYDGNVEILKYDVEKSSIKVMRIGNDEYWRYEANIYFIMLAAIICGIGVSLMISAYQEDFW